MAKEFTNFCKTNFPLTIRFGDDAADGVLRWSGRDATMDLPNGRVARVSLSVEDIHGKYEKLVVRIVNLMSGEVDRKEFPFQEYLSSRSDSRTDYRGGFYVSNSGGDLGWYIAQPGKVKAELLSEVEEYIRTMARG